MVKFLLLTDARTGVGSGSGFYISIKELFLYPISHEIYGRVMGLVDFRALRSNW